jgi:Ubiquitin-activating enzyme E1 FCCH domain
MPIPLIKTNFTAGEVSPSLFGHVDLARYAAACSTLRNMWVSYRGGAYSRAGTLFCGYSKQTRRTYAPRLIPFQFNIDQGLALEFGNYYMRVLFDGGFVLEPGLGITGITRADPGVVTIAAYSAASATANNGSVSASYAPGDTVTLAGGTFSQAAVLTIVSTGLAAAPTVSSSGTWTAGLEYSPGDFITLAGGKTTVQAQVQVLTTVVNNAVVSASGSGGTPGPAVVTGTNGTGTKFTANVTIGAGGHIASVDSIATGGSYTANPLYFPTDGGYFDPVTGGGLSGAELQVSMGVGTVQLANPGVFTANPAGGNLVQSSTTGFGLGATFNGALFGPNSLAVTTPGVYSVQPTNPVSQSATSGSGVRATFNLTWASAGFNTGDWIYLSDIAGMTELNGNTYVITSLTSTTFSLQDVFGNNINTSAFTAYSSGGLASRVYTLTTPYNEQDLPWLKFTQSADVMSMCCVNQTSLVEYAPQDLDRLADDDWQFTAAVPGPSIGPPAGAAGTASTSGLWYYAYEITAIAADGTESIASNIAEIASAVDITATAGAITLTWDAVQNNYGYYIYKASPAYGAAPPAGSQFGFAGQALGTQFVDSNITPDFQQVPGTAQNPFVNGQILGVQSTAGGSGYTSASITITTSSGSGFAAYPIIVSGAVVAWVITNNGMNYGPNDTATVSGNGTGATASVTVGPQSGNYPSLPSYFQERRGYFNSTNNPDTYWFSQPGAYLNFNFRVPPIATDAITGTPWGVQVNGIQWAIQTSGGLLIMTGLSAWLLVGAGTYFTSVQPISPSSQDAVVQAFFGISSLVVPTRINYDVLFVDATGQYYYDLPYQLYTLTEPIDLTELSKHLFTNYNIVENAYCQEPNKILWAVRSDGILLSLTYYKTQQISGWARHDTSGYFESVCSIREPPVDALYLATNRNFNGNQAYMIERMDNRQWTNVEDAWCVDCGLEYPLTYPDATVTASSATGLGSISGYTGLVGGAGYSSGTTFTVVDDNGEGPGTGAAVTGTISGGVVTALTIGSAGANYINPQIYANDPEGSAGGSGFLAKLTLNNTVTFTATNGTPFSSGDVGSYLRMGGGVAVITAKTSSTVDVGNMLTPITDLIPGGNAPAPQTAGDWSLTAPVTVVSGLDHLDGATVTGVADGQVIPPTVVSGGSITLGTAASRIIIGLGFTAQLQTIKLDAGSPTVQGQRKKIAAVTIRLDASGAFMSGENQVDGSTLNPIQIAPQWNNLNVVPNRATPNYNNPALPLYTGDVRVKLASNFATPGQVAVEQSAPLPLGILALIPELLPGDIPDIKEPEKQRGR